MNSMYEPMAYLLIIVLIIMGVGYAAVEITYYFDDNTVDSFVVGFIVSALFTTILFYDPEKK